jgi:hypothetical protein
MSTGDWSPIEGPISNEVQELFFAPAAPKSRGKKPKVPLAPQHRKSIYGRYGSHDYPALRCVEINGISVSPILALMEAITARLSLTRFVIWWSDVDGELVPGLYCPDRLTAYYAFAIRSIGAVGGWAICQRCGKNYLRRRTQQLYCTHKCQVAAAMKRFRGGARDTPEERKASSKKTNISTGGSSHVAVSL